MGLSVEDVAVILEINPHMVILNTQMKIFQVIAPLLVNRTFLKLSTHIDCSYLNNL